MKPKYDVGQKVMLSFATSTDKPGIVQSFMLTKNDTYVYKVRFPGGAEYSYAEWELKEVEKVKP